MFNLASFQTGIKLKAFHFAGLGFLLACALLAAATPAAGASSWVKGADTWGGRQALPAVVNPVVRSWMQSFISLRGEWEFTTHDVAPLRHPEWNAFYAKPWPGARTIQVPGCWEEQGVGSPGMASSWDCKWDHIPKPLRSVYTGEAWYRKKVELPLSWKGQRVWLKIGGVKAQGCFWVNDKPVAWVDNYCGTYKYDITDLVEPGKTAVVVAQVNNTAPSRKGLFSALHKFGGLYRDVELEATPAVRIDYAWIRGDFDKQLAEANVTLGRAAAATPLSKPVLRVTIKTADGKPAGDGRFDIDPQKAAAEFKCAVPLTLFQPWSPDSPSLYVADLVLCDGNQAVHGWTERFGLRKFEVRGDRFYFNNQPFFVRGYGDDLVYPMTLTSPASREDHLSRLKIARQAGFVYARLHTHCELPEYFEAADEAGILLQPELPYYGDYPTEAFAFDPMRDLEELILHYRRHASLATYCMGNEGLLGRPLDRELYQLARRLDPDRLVLHQDGALNTAENSDFRNGPITVWEPGSFPCDAPFVAHEYLNLCVKLDPRLESRFTGAWLPPVTMAGWDKHLGDAGLDRGWGEACQDAMHQLQRHYQKQGVESARLDPSCDGFDFWTIVDVVVQQGNSYSAQGLFNPFWEPKSGGFTAREFRSFNDQTVLLLKSDPDARIAVSGDKIHADFWISHFGTQPLSDARLSWVLRSENTILAQGASECGDVAMGSVRSMAQVDIGIPHVPKPVHAILEAALGPIRNRWDFWVFPRRVSSNAAGIAVSRPLLPALGRLYTGLIAAGDAGSDKAELLVSFLGSDDVETALAAGKRVVLINGAEGKPNVSLGWWAMGQQVGTAFARHPALGDFPHEGYLSPLSFRILKQGRKLPCFAGMRDMFIVGEGGDSYYLYAGEARVGQARVLMTFGLDLLSDFPEGACLLDGLIGYARSAAFDPKGEVTLGSTRTNF